MSAPTVRRYPRTLVETFHEVRAAAAIERPDPRRDRWSGVLLAIAIGVALGIALAIFLTP